MIKLGENITLVGFKELHPTELSVVKEKVETEVQKIAGSEQVNELRLIHKQIHHTADDSTKFELKATLDLNGKIYNAEVIDFNLYIGMDSILNKLETQVKNKH